MILKKIKYDVKFERILFIVFLGITFFYMLFLNTKTPLIADDYVYTFMFGTSIPVIAITDIIQSQLTYYATWGGRIVAESLTQLFVFWGKSVFNIANSVCYIVFILSIYFNAVGRKIKPMLLLAVIVITWFFIPMFGQTVMWLTGSCNYLWCGTLVLMSVVPFRLYEEKQTKALKSIWFSIATVPLFFISGITNENTAGGMILIMILFCVLYYKRGMKIPAFAFVGLFFSISGFLCMIFAPGNVLRVDNESAVAEVTKIVGSNPIITRLSYFGYNLYDLMPLIIIAVVAFMLLYKCKEKQSLYIFGIFSFAAAASLIVMLVPPKFPPRAMFGLVAFIIIAIIYAIDQFKISQRMIKKFVVTPSIIIVFYYIMSLGYVGIDSIMVMKQYEVRVAIIEDHKDEKYIELPKIEPLTSHNGLYGLRDVQLDPNHWVNRALADFYGVENIILKIEN